MSKISFIALVALQIGIATSAFAAPQHNWFSGVSSQEQALNDRVGPTEAGQR